MKKILIPTWGFFPANNYGGPPVSISNLCTLLKDHYHFYVVCADHEMGSKNRLEGISDGWNHYKDVAHVMYLPDKELKYDVFKSIVNDLKPDVLYLNSLFNAKFTLPFISIAKKTGIPLLLAPRGEINIEALDKLYKKIPYIYLVNKMLRGMNVIFHSTCEEESHQINKFFDCGFDNIKLLPNVPSIPSEIMVPRKGNDFSIVFFSRIVPKKNLDYALDVLHNICDLNIVFDIYGNIEDTVYWKKCCEKIDNLPTNITARYRGIIEHSNIYETLGQYKLFFFPTQSENYGHVIAEALFSGMPVLISDQTPWNDVDKYDAGAALPLNNPAAFEAYIRSIYYLSDEEYCCFSKKAQTYVKEKTNLHDIKGKYLEVFGI